MAKTQGPLLSLDAHGSFGRVLTYSHRKSGRQVRTYNKPLVAASAKQRGQRRLTEFLVAQWQNMSAGDKATWEANARLSGPHITGYHYFLREAQRDLYTHTGLCGYWHCNEIVNGYVKDISGNALHGALKPSWPDNAPVLADSYKTKFSKALLYDGVDEMVEMPLSSKLELTINFSFLCWIKQTVSTEANKGCMGKYDVDGRRSWALQSAWYNNWRAAIAVGDVAYVTAPNINIGTGWNQLVGTYDGETLLFYVNGVQRASNSDMSGAIDMTAAQHFRFGETPALGFMPGLVDEVCIYNRLLSAAEILTRYKFAIREVD